MVGLQILFCLSFFPKFCAGNICCFCNKNNNDNNNNKAGSRGSIPRALISSQHSSELRWREGAGRKQATQGPPAKGHTCYADSPWWRLAGTHEAYISVSDINKPSTPTVVKCFHKALPQAISHLPKDRPLWMNVFFWKPYTFIWLYQH